MTDSGNNTTTTTVSIPAQTDLKSRNAKDKNDANPASDRGDHETKMRPLNAKVTTNLLSLPRELRDEIYDHYYRCENGYLFNPRSGKLTQHDGHPIELSLGLACRAIAAETQELALKLNVIKFSTSFSGSANEMVSRFDVLIRILDSIKTELLLGSAKSAGHIDQAVHNYVAQRFPQYLQIMPHISQTLAAVPMDIIAMLGETPLLSRQFITSLLEFISTQPHFKEKISISRAWDKVEPNYIEVMASKVLPWSMPHEHDLEALEHLVYRRFVAISKYSHIYKYWSEVKHRLSAAATAIRFLKDTPTFVRKRIRNIHLDEDRIAVAWPECHAQGLIPFCQENPRLRIARHANLWRNVFQSRAKALHAIPDMSPQDIRDARADCLHGEDVSQSIAPWVKEALALPSLGMPSNAFTLTLDGSPLPDKTASIFQNIQRDAAWQEAFESQFSNVQYSSGPPAWYRIRQKRLYFTKGFPEAIRDITNSTSLMKCNFDVGSHWEVEPIVEKGRDWMMVQWEAKWLEIAEGELASVEVAQLLSICS